jgi:hypothetical protein
VARRGQRGKKVEGTRAYGLRHDVLSTRKMTSPSGSQTVNYSNNPSEPAQMIRGRTLEPSIAQSTRSALESKVTTLKGLIRPNVMDDGNCRRLLRLIEL